MIKNAAIYTVSTIISSAIPFLLLPILTRYLTPEDYGAIAMFTLLIAAMSAVAGLSVHGAANRRYYDDATDEKLARFNANCLVILLISFLVLFLILIATVDLISAYLMVPTMWIYVALCNSAISFIINMRLGQWRVRNKPIKFGITQILYSFSNISLTILFVVVLELNAQGRVYAMLISTFFVGLISLFSLFKERLLLFEVSKEDIKYALNFGVPLIPHVIGGFLLNSIDRLVLNQQLGLKETGIYMVAVGLGAGVNMLFTSINQAYSPWLYSQLKSVNHLLKLRLVRTTYLTFLFLIVVALISWFITPLLLRLIVDESFYSASFILKVIVLAQIFNGMYMMLASYILYSKKNKNLSIITITSGAVNIFLLLFLVPRIGINGAAYSFLAACFFKFVLTWYISNKVYPMPWFSNKKID